MKPAKLFEVKSPLMFKTCHSLGEGRFLAAGGMYSMSNAPSSHSCAMAVYDSTIQRWLWQTELPKNRIFDLSCVSGSIAVGASCIATRKKSSGIISIDAVNGEQVNQFTSLPALNSLCSLDSDTWIAGTWVEESQLTFGSINSQVSKVISRDPSFRIRKLTNAGHSLFVSTMQHIYNSNVVYIHQLRNADNHILWEYGSDNDCVAKCNNEYIALYSEASGNKVCFIELIDIATGRMVRRSKLLEPIASLTHLCDDCFVYCNSSYEAVFASKFGCAITAKSEFPKGVDGWMSFAIDYQRREVFACKGNNYQDPSSFINIFQF